MRENGEAMRRIGSALLLAQNRAREEKERADRCESLLKVIVKNDVASSLSAGDDAMLRSSLSMEDWDLLQSLIHAGPGDMHASAVGIPTAEYAGTPKAPTAVVEGEGLEFHPPSSSGPSSGASCSGLFMANSSTSSEIEHIAQQATESHARAVREVEEEDSSNFDPSSSTVGGTLAASSSSSRSELPASTPTDSTSHSSDKRHRLAPKDAIAASSLSWLDSLFGISTRRGRIEVLLGFVLGLAAGSLWSRHLLTAKEARIVELSSTLERARVQPGWAKMPGTIATHATTAMEAASVDRLVSWLAVVNSPICVFYGGHVSEENLLVNNVMETDDHGPINFWDRQIFFWNADGINGTPSAETRTVPFRTKIRQNFMVANYGANGGCIGSDDGTSYHDVVGNACMLGGFKSDNFQGHPKRCVGNLNIFPNVYGPSCAWLYPGPLTGYPRPYWPATVELEETYANNTCVVGENFNYVYFPSDCDFAAPHSIRFRLGNNTIISPDNSTVVQGCDGKQLSVQEWLKLGTDKGSIVREFSPTSDKLVAMVKALLNF